MKLHIGKVFKKFTGLLLTLALCTASLLYTSLHAWAEPAYSIPEPGADFYYSDQAGLLSGETRALILTKNAGLSPLAVQLVVMTMDSFPVEGYTQRVEYLQAVMQSWQVGGPEGRGLLLALAVSDDDYIAVAGDGLQACFDAEQLKSMLDAQLEADFSARAYDSGVSKFITDAADKAQAWASSQEGQPAVQPEAQASAKKDGGPSVLVWVALAAGAVAVLALAVFIISGRPSRRRYGSRRGVHRHTPLVTPPRTTVLRHESHTPIIVKSSNRGDGPSRIRKL